jgi:multidrug resistance efflux pump
MGQVAERRAVASLSALFGRRWLVAALVLLLLAGSAVGAIAMRLARPPTEEDAVSDGMAVRAALVLQGDIVETTRLTGTLAANINLNLNAKVAGVVARVPVVMGQRVRRGDVLLELSGSDLMPQVKAAEAQLEAARLQVARLERGASHEDLQLAQASVDQAQAGWEAASRACDRMTFLYAEGAVSRQQLEAAETQLKVSTAQLAMAQAQLQKAKLGPDQETIQAARAQARQAEAAYDAARARLDDTILRAPANGLISYVRVSVGELVSPGVPQVGLVDADTLYLDAAVTENVVARLIPGRPVDVTVSAAGLVRPGTIDQISPAADARTRAYGVRIRIVNTEGQLRAGMGAEVVVETARAAAALTVPRQSIVAAGEESLVYVVRDGLAERRVVILGAASGDRVVVTGAIAGGEVVVTLGAGLLRDGQRVNIIGGPPK